MMVEFDTPVNLLAYKGIFYSMAKEECYLTRLDALDRSDIRNIEINTDLTIFNPSLCLSFFVIVRAC